MKNTPAPKRLQKKEPGKSKAPLIISVVIAALLALAVGGYFGFCSWVRDNGMTLPGTVVSGLPGGETVDISRMNADDAVDLVESRMNDTLAQRALTVSYGSGNSATVFGTALHADPALPISAAMEEKAAIPLYELGLRWFGYYGGSAGQTLSALTITEEGLQEISQLAARITKALYVAPLDFSWTVTEETVELTRGMDGQQVNEEALRQAITDALLTGESRYAVTAEPVPSADLTAEILRDLVTVEPQVSRLLEDGTITPTANGYSIDPAEAQAILDGVGPGESCSIPLIPLIPDIAPAQDILFQDVLCSSETYMAGPDGRRTNIKLAAAAINGTVVLPGETFSYNAIVGERTAEKGYQKATVYVQGEDRQELGGGICQLASAIYYCCLYSDLEIVERKPHRFAVTYVPYGLDATIAWGSIDYKFTNNTDYPIRIDATTKGVNLIVHLYGTKANDNYVKMERKQLSTTPYETTYELDPTFVSGQTEERVHAYTGYEYDTYRCVYDGEGNLLSRTYEDYSRYRARDKVIAISPADAAQYGIDAATGKPIPGWTPSTPEPSPSPAPSEDPSPSADPAPSESDDAPLYSYPSDFYPGV